MRDLVTVLLAASVAVVSAGSNRPVSVQAVPTSFDHEYRAYSALLRSVVREPRVDYQQLQRRAADLRAVEAVFGGVRPEELARWTREQQMAFWSNAYNVFTLRAIVDHFPIRGSFFSLGPRNSIRQISGVWDTLKWTVAGRQVTLDDIEHKILRPTFQEPLVHFAVNCASVSCPVLAAEPYRAPVLRQQLEAAARKYLASPLGLVVNGTTVSVSSIFKWYGDDFIVQYRDRGPARGSDSDRAILGVVASLGPEAAAKVARSGTARVRFLDYDWTLNDVQGSGGRQ